MTLKKQSYTRVGALPFLFCMFDYFLWLEALRSTRSALPILAISSTIRTNVFVYPIFVLIVTAVYQICLIMCFMFFLESHYY